MQNMYSIYQLKVVEVNSSLFKGSGSIWPINGEVIICGKRQIKSKGKLSDFDNIFGVGNDDILVKSVILAAKDLIHI